METISGRPTGHLCGDSIANRCGNWCFLKCNKISCGTMSQVAGDTKRPYPLFVITFLSKNTSLSQRIVCDNLGYIFFKSVMFNTIYFLFVMAIIFVIVRELLLSPGFDQCYMTSLGKLRSNWRVFSKYRKSSNKSRTLVGNKVVDHSDVVGASPVGAAPTTSSCST